ncbi:hypothetical protein I4U23_016457 [Adineta vaga]|nr:hypothetical protein I4U23_016457 [Adineta vaga]
MNSLTVISLLVLLPVCIGIRCYTCTAGQSGCDPINTASLSPTSGHTYCKKVWSGSQSTTVRSGETTCVEANVAGIGTYCCSTDACNGAISKYQIPYLMGLVLAALFAKYQFV